VHRSHFLRLALVAVAGLLLVGLVGAAGYASEQPRPTAGVEHDGHAGYAPAAPGDDVPIATDCAQSALPAHTGFQVAPACVRTSFGEVAAQANNPQLLIVDAPLVVRAGQDITMRVSTRNLIRDRFLPAGTGGYYAEIATLTDGITRGHVHAACRIIGRTAPQPERNASFKAVEDGGGGPGENTFTVTVPGLQGQGRAQCMAWAGDGSHRIPMMQFANQMPAVDTRDLAVIGEGPRGRVRGDGDGG